MTPLLREVSEIYKIKFHRELSDTWTSQVEGNELHVGYVKTSAPGGALAHELLHGWVQHRGYKRLIIAVSAIDQTRRFGRLLECLDNELQHHKMYPRFKALGFNPTEFYCDSDDGASKYLHSVLERPERELLDIIPDYLTAIAPGGGLTEAERAGFDSAFRCISDGRHASALGEIHDAVAEWATSDDFDVRPIVARILHQLANPCDTWIGHSEIDRPPDKGFFVDRKFAL